MSILLLKTIPKKEFIYFFANYKIFFIFAEDIHYRLTEALNLLFYRRESGKFN